MFTKIRRHLVNASIFTLFRFSQEKKFDHLGKTGFLSLMARSKFKINL
jgi:hypothetical protein